MPLSPLIRPLSPLQTQCAPLLPEPCSLSNVVLYSAAGEAFHKGYTASSTFSPAAAPRYVGKTSGTPFHHQSAQDGMAEEMLRESYVAQVPAFAESHHGQKQARCRRCHDEADASCAQTATQARTFTGDQSLSIPRPQVSAGTSEGLSRVRKTIRSGSPDPKSQPSVSPPALHPYMNASNMSGSRAHLLPQNERSTAPPVVSASRLLRAASTTAMGAAQPSYGAALLGRRSLSPAQAGGSYRYASRTSYERVPVLGSTRIVSPLLFGETAVDAACSDEKDLAALTITRPQTDENGTLYHGTAVSNRTGRSYQILISAAPVAPNHVEVPLAANDKAAASSIKLQNIPSFLPVVGGGDWNAGLSHSPTATTAIDGAKVAVAGVPHGTILTDGPNRGGACLRYGNGIATEVLFDEAGTQPASSACVTASGASTDPEAQPSQSVAKVAATSAPPLKDSRSSLSSASPPSLSPRYVYPALEECRRLLDEIRTVSPLLCRCLTPPRPLESSTAEVAIPADRSSQNTESCVLKSNVAATPRELTASPRERDTHLSYKGAYAPPKRATLAPGAEARRLYRWDPATAAEDLSFMRGPFQQSSDRFATSVARQLERLQEVGSRRYGTAAASAMRSVATTTTAVWPQPMHSSCPPSCSESTVEAAAPPVSFADQLENGEETPATRLRRVLNETAAGLQRPARHDQAATAVACDFAAANHLTTFASGGEHLSSNGQDFGPPAGKAGEKFAEARTRNGGTTTSADKWFAFRSSPDSLMIPRPPPS